MIDPKILRDQPDLVRASQRTRGASPESVDVALDADRARRDAISEFERLRAEQKQISDRVKTAAPDEKQAAVAAAREFAQRVKDAQSVQAEAEQAFTDAMMRIDNIVHPDVPAGGEDDFTLLKTHGEPTRFDFEPRDHVELGELLGAFDLQRGAKVAGSRFYYLTGPGMRLELALMLMGLDVAQAQGFVPLTTPTLVGPQIMQGTGFLGEHADEVYYLPADDLYLTGTSEVALAGFHADEILDLSAGPKRYAGWSTCYRREAGSHGKDTRGIVRVHQFNKLEMFSYTDPADAEAEHDLLRSIQEEMLQRCELSYRVIDVAAGDLGSSAARKFDIEAWVPTQGVYRELTSTSNCTTFQSRRLQTRQRVDGQTQPVATLNGTAATTRWIVAILEEHQQADGSVVVPEALRPYMGGVQVLEPR